MSYNNKELLDDKYTDIKVSVIVPTYNSQDHIKDCLTSLLNQTLKEIQIIVIDNNSTDDTYNIISKFAKAHKNIRITSQPKFGLGVAKNRAMYLAKGEYLSFIKPDDFVDFDFFETLYYHAKSDNSYIAIASTLYLSSNKNKKSNTYHLEIKTLALAKTLEEKIKISQTSKEDFFCVYGKIYKRKFIEDYEIFFDKYLYFDDVLFSLKALTYSNSLVAVPNTTYYCRFTNTKKT